LYCLLTYWQEENVSKTHGNEWQVLDSVIILSLPPPPPPPATPSPSSSWQGWDQIQLISLSLQNQIHMMIIDDRVGLFSSKTRKGACLLHEHRVDMVDNFGGMPD
jgi:hypothetical protein